MTHTLILFFSLLVEAVVLFQYSSCLFIPLRSFRIRAALLSFLYLMLFFLSLLEITWFNLIGYFLANTLFLLTQFDIGILLSLFHSTILSSIMGISELAVFGTISLFFPGFLTDKNAGFFLLSISSKLLFLTVIYILTRIFRTKNYRHHYTTPIDSVLLLIPILSLSIMFTLFTTWETIPSVTPTLSTLLTAGALCLLFINLLVFGVQQYTQKKYMEFTDMQLQLQKEADSAEYYKMLLSQNENQNILIHDIKKHLHSIQLLNEQKNFIKIATYIQQLMKSSDLKEAARICDNEMLNAILCRYQRHCADKQVAFYADIRKKTVNTLEDQDLTSLFCNLLDNALEAAQDIPDSFIELSVQRKDNSAFLVIVVINSCRSAPSCDRKGFPISVKKDKSRHGFGLKSIRNTVKKYNGNLQMYYEASSATFHTIITLKP